MMKLAHSDNSIIKGILCLSMSQRVPTLNTSLIQQNARLIILRMHNKKFGNHIKIFA
jgi:hypothetical protein